MRSDKVEYLSRAQIFESFQGRFPNCNLMHLAVKLDLSVLFVTHRKVVTVQYCLTEEPGRFL